MLTKNEITALNLSPTKKDFVQIWNELLEVAGKLSERWDPTSTNESDPGIVILKALTGIADKLNYNIDKNTLEAFMPTAAQEDSMRKLCDMLGYNVKYYRSAEVDVTIKYHNASPSDDEETALSNGLLIPKFTVITNNDKDISYFTTNKTPYYISNTTSTVPLSCMEGQIIQCESTADNNVITVSQISENNRFYLPEAQVAENGIFVYNVYSDKDYNLVDDGTPWEKVDNLNVQVRGSRVFKFGYDSYESRPYIEFPEDYSELINDGLFIYYARTNGANGNISPGTLTQLELPTGDGWDKVSAESFSVENTFAATSGANIETINQAYNNFKKTVGTFETLVTCRDYMNKIYTMTSSGKPLVSNILVTDIRNDLNRAVTICSCDDAGIFYKETPLTVYTEADSTEITDSTTQRTISNVNKPRFNPTKSVNGSHWFLGETDVSLAKTAFITGGRSSAFNAGEDGDVVADKDGYWHIYQPKDRRTFNCKTNLQIVNTATKQTTTTKTIEIKPAIDHFDLVLYPFKSYNQIRNNVRDIQEVYDSSFKYSLASFNNVKDKLDVANVKTIAHNIVSPNPHDIVSINNYLRLSAIIGTNSKVTVEEGELLKETIKIALANAFNMRELDFGEEIPFESIIEVIEKADSRIRVVSLNEPALYTTFSVFEGLDTAGNVKLQEYAVASDWLSETAAIGTGRFENKETNTHTFNSQEAKKIYNKLAVRNVLAGRVPLFKYNTTYSTDFSEGAYTVATTVAEESVPANLGAPTANNPFTIYVDVEKDKTYTGEYIPLSALPEVEGVKLTEIEPTEPGQELTVEKDNIKYIGKWEEGSEEPTYAKIVYTEKAVPEEYTEGNVIKNDTDAKFTSITTSCKIKADPLTGSISDVTLAEGEFIKFRAPNFSTDKTYPAYVNYHLQLNKSIEAEAKYAEADLLFSLLNSDTEKATRGQKWEAVLDYFEQHKKTFKFTQKVSASEPDKDLIISIDNSKLPAEVKTPADVLAKSGCVKLRSVEPILEWSDDVSGEEALPDLDTLTLRVPDDIDTLYFTSSDMFVKSSKGNTTSIPDLVDKRLSELATKDKLPKSQAWTISYEFEYVPFDGATLADWGKFVKDNSLALFGFTPAIEGDTILWRTYGEGYAEGKYILGESNKNAKLMPFTSGFLSALEEPIKNVYVATSLGSDIKATKIDNGEEYMLRSGEKLYIEYTPSTTTEEGTTQELDSVKEVLGPGTIIKPNGFEQGLIASTELAKSSSPHKQVTFTDSIVPIDMFSFGANEQVEIRDFAKVTLDKKSFTDSSVICFYKNFNNCDELEVARYTNGKRINNSYTLKDGEYIFYTDENKTELAYFTTGTEVTLEGKLTIPKFEVIDLVTIFDSGLDEIPWVSKNLTTSDSITFQEFQYITLGPGDTLKQLAIVGTQDYLDENWQSCSEVEYYPAGAENSSKLDKINISDELYSGNGWEACSILELNVSPSIAQTLRNTDKVETSITLKRPNSAINEDVEVKVDNVNDPPKSFKTNLPCQSSISKINISDIYNNPNNIDSFELKVFADKTPTLMHTKKGTLLPYHEQVVADSSAEWTTADFSMKNYGEVWNQVALAKLAPANEEAEDDNTLRLSASILPNTYGIFSIYLDYGAVETASARGTWIQLLPGASQDAVTLFNTEDDWFDGDKLALKQGINCIRVNKTGDIFIKTNQSIGAIYFDDLRLVDATPIEYIEGNKKKSLTPLGLNLSQIGYLDASSEASKNTFNIFDMRIRRKLRDEYTATALAALEDRDVLETKNIESYWKNLTTDKVKLQTLVTFLETAKQEIVQLKSTDYSGLFAKYKAIYNSLTKEQALKEALDDNQNIDDLEQRLIALLDSFTNVEDSRQEILTKLEQLKEAAEANAENFTVDQLRKGDILDDFEAVADTTIYPYLVEDIKFASRRKISARYGEQLDVLAADIEKVLTSEEALTNALNYLRATKQTTLLEQIKLLVSTYNNTLIETIEDAQSAAGKTVESTEVADYAELESILYGLKEQVSNAGINLLITRIESYAESGLYTDLAETVDALKLLLETVGTNNEIISAINTLLIKVQAKTDSVPDNVIKTDLSNLATLINNSYKDQLAEILTKIETLITALKNTFTSAKTYLEDSQDIQVKAILKRLETISETASACLAIVASFGEASEFDIKEDYSGIPFGEYAVLNTWPTYMSQSLSTGVSQLYGDIREAVKNPAAATFDDSVFYSVGDKPRAILVKAVNLEAFRELFESAKTLAAQSSQIDARKELIEQLSNQITVPAAISAAKTAMDAVDGEDRNAVIYDLITKLSQSADSYSVSEKQQLISKLKEELTKAIDLDTQLEEISAKLLCPSILIFEKELPTAINDSFYSKLSLFVKKQKETIQTENMSTSSLADLELALDDAYTVYDTLLTAVKENNQSDVVAWEDLVDTLLADAFVENLANLKASTAVKDQITKIYECKLFNYIKDLKDEFVIAWQDDDGNFMDSAGQYFKKYIGTTADDGTTKYEWYTYDQYTRDAKLIGKGEWFYIEDTEEYWRTSDDKLVIVDLKHTKEGAWLEYPNIPIQVVGSLNNNWILLDGSTYTVSDEELNTILTELYDNVSSLAENRITAAAKEAYATIALEEDLLNDIRTIDRYNAFYYNVPVEANVAIDFNESDDKLNTLMNPAVNYDINNVNNPFVISKLDINYLTKGLQIARSSKLN